MSLSAKEESRRPSPWENVIHKSGKHILAYEQHFASARYIGNQPQINMGCRIHEFEAFSETHGKGLGGVRRDPRTGKLYVDSSKLDCVSSLSRLLTRLWLQIMLVVSSSEKLPLIFMHCRCNTSSRSRERMFPGWSSNSRFALRAT